MTQDPIHPKGKPRLVERLNKDARGTLMTILVLGVINKQGRTWGYQIKQEIQELTRESNPITDSSLYTILRSMEKHYAVLESDFIQEERRRYYNLTEWGKTEFENLLQEWWNLTRLGKLSLNELGLGEQK